MRCAPGYGRRVSPALDRAGRRQGEFDRDTVYLQRDWLAGDSASIRDALLMTSAMAKEPFSSAARLLIESSRRDTWE